MKVLKAVGVTIFVCSGVALGSTHHEINNGWAEACDVNPTTATPAQLRDYGHLLSSSEKDEVADDDDDWYRFNESTQKDYDYIMVVFPDNGNETRADLRWQVGIDASGQEVSVFYWKNSNNSWVYLDINGGGRTPNTEYTDVTSAYENSTEHVIFLFAGYSGSAGSYIQCDVSDMETIP